ncbi:aspartate-semialdehyde dehydrogenase [Candidatus Woesearchaeota archaeon]|nr:aspartate-semialdehyde dehydrogenase [Candidatus Woesearchaeota archaeon]
MSKLKVGVLGATGMVGQRFVQLLENHPWFEVTALAASEKSAGKSYGEAVAGRWKVSSRVPDYARKIKISDCAPDIDCSIVFSALDAGIAGRIEQSFAAEGYAVSSNSRNHRMEPDVPLIVPEVNSSHLELIDSQKKGRGWKGFIVTNPNCSTIHMCLALKPLHDTFRIEKAMVTTMQALSGAGYPGVASMDIIDNVIPFISGEEEKIETETLKILGSLSGSSVENAGLAVSASCNRVAVSDGHMESVSVKLSMKADEQGIVDAFRGFNPLRQLGLPSSPSQPVIVSEEPDRPQPRLDRNLESGMCSVVGRVRKCGVLDFKFTVLGHNTIRGAAGAAIMNAELMKVKGYI